MWTDCQYELSPCVSEPFDGSNTARAVHEKMKFDAIKTEFMEV